MKGLTIITATAALALMPQAAVAKTPLKAKDRSAKVERTAKQDASAQQRCRDERKALGAAPFAAKYGKARTKGSAKAKAKAARAAFGRCVAQTTKLIRAEREAARAEEDLAAEDELEGERRDAEELDEDDDGAGSVVVIGVDDDPDADDTDEAEGDARAPHGGKHGAADAPGGKHADDDADDADDDAGDDDRDEADD